MRYFSSNFTHVVQIGSLSDYRTSTDEGLQNLGLLANEVASVFDLPMQAVFHEFVRAIEHGKNGDAGYYKATTLAPAMAEAFWSISRVMFDTLYFAREYRGLGRSQAVVCDLNVGVCALVISKIDYEGCHTDGEITTRAFL